MRHISIIAFCAAACAQPPAGSVQSAPTEESADGLAATCDPVTPPGCYRPGPEAAVIDNVEGAAAWFDASAVLCPPSKEIWLCDGCMPRPDTCLAIGGGQPSIEGQILQTFCCSVDGVTPAPPCTSGCPPSPSQCYEPVCLNGNTCAFSFVAHNGLPCKGGPGFVCSIKSPKGPFLCGPQ